MKNILKDIAIYAITILINVGAGLLLNAIFFPGDTTNFIMFACGFIIFFLLVIYLISQKMGYKLDIFAYNTEDVKFMILNNIFIGILFSIPVSMFISVLL